MDNALRVSADKVQPGMYFKFGGHKVQEYLWTEWWKVTNREGNAVRLVNKAGQTKTMLVNLYGLKFIQWVPGQS